MSRPLVRSPSGTYCLKFEILLPQEEANAVMLYEVYASSEAFEAHWNGPSKQQAERFKNVPPRGYLDQQPGLVH
jgi:quinol monooxygenase YgiN